jgi:phage baseplate assembly protein W
MADFGKGISCVPDLGDFFVLKSGHALLGEALARRLSTPRGTLFYAPEYGRDVRIYLSETLTGDALARIAAEVEAEVERDERVTKASATVTAPTLEQLQIALSLETGEGPFTLVLAVSAVTVEILRAGV